MLKFEAGESRPPPVEIPRGGVTRRTFNSLPRFMEARERIHGSSFGLEEMTPGWMGDNKDRRAIKSGDWVQGIDGPS